MLRHSYARLLFYWRPLTSLGPRSVSSLSRVCCVLQVAAQPIRPALRVVLPSAPSSQPSPARIPTTFHSVPLVTPFLSLFINHFDYPRHHYTITVDVSRSFRPNTPPSISRNITRYVSWKPHKPSAILPIPDFFDTIVPRPSLPLTDQSAAHSGTPGHSQ